MSGAWFMVLLGVSVVGCSMVAGFFLTFSDVVMRSLLRAKVESGVEVMQIINREVWRSITIGLLWGTLALTLVLVGVGLMLNLTRLPLVLIGTGCAFYVVGGLVVSYARNLPMNDRLASMEYASLPAGSYWQTEYVARWVSWNWVRAFSAMSAAVCFLLAMVLLSSR